MFGFSRRRWKAPGGEMVVRKEVYTKTGISGALSTYEIWTAPSEESAKAYLNTRDIAKPLYYLVVETPRGNWGKDKMGVYRE